MGWSEREYFESSPESVYYAFQGYFDKRKADERMFRNLGWINYKINGGKLNNPNDLWPIDKEKKKEDVKTWGSKEEKDEMIKKIMEAHKIKLNV